MSNLSNHDLQLKQWLDQTEVELGRRLSSRATSFLAAVSAQDQLKNILKEARETASSLRDRVHQVGVSGTKSNFSAINCSRKSARLKSVLDRVKYIQTVQQRRRFFSCIFSVNDSRQGLTFFQIIFRSSCEIREICELFPKNIFKHRKKIP